MSILHVEEEEFRSQRKSLKEITIKMGMESRPEGPEPCFSINLKQGLPLLIYHRYN